MLPHEELTATVPNPVIEGNQGAFNHMKEHAFHSGLVHESITDTEPVKEHNTG
jgi:hypothetical protein